jgi:hypothetical protein
MNPKSHFNNKLKIIKMQDDFYIGWRPEAPGTFAKFVRKYLYALILMVIVIGIALAILQKKFSTATFEFGKLTTVKGSYSAFPVPHLSVVNNQDRIMIPLVGYGKSGAEGIMYQLEQEIGQPLENKEITLRGQLMYGDGKVIMQVDKKENPLVGISKEEKGRSSVNKASVKELGNLSFIGEIVDSKCYFGVMKPGEGKPHKDCAIRCILGGVPPVMAITNKKGERNYILLTSSNGKRINDEVKDFVAIPSKVSGHAFQYDNWIVLQVNEIKNMPAAMNNRPSSSLAIGCRPSDLCNENKKL